jgi:hypothetical protein
LTALVDVFERFSDPWLALIENPHEKFWRVASETDDRAWLDDVDVQPQCIRASFQKVLAIPSGRPSGIYLSRAHAKQHIGEETLFYGDLRSWDKLVKHQPRSRLDISIGVFSAPHHVSFAAEILADEHHAAVQWSV